jgi:NifU-like protein involved in Fe-S cluster formation
LNAPLYTTEILRLATSLPEPVRLDREDGDAELRSPTCGSWVRAAVQMRQDRVAMLSLEVQACAFGQASSTLLSRHAAGCSREEVAQAVEQLSAWLDGDSEVPGDWPQITALSPARSRKSRHAAILLPWRAFLAAMTAAQGDQAR